MLSACHREGYGECLLMHVAQEVVDGLHGVEGRERHLHEHRVPVAHGAVPQSGQLEGFQRLAVFRLAADESCLRVHILAQVERLALVVFRGAHQVDGVEVGAAGEHLGVGLVVLVYLRALEYLRAHRAVLVVGEEWSAARLAHVANHSAYAERAVEL